MSRLVDGSRLRRGVRTTFIALALLYALTLAVAFFPRVTTPRSALLRPEDRLVQVGGHTLRYRSYPAQRDEQKPTLIMLHGFAGSSYTWRKVAPLVADVANVVAFDIMPFGLSDKPTAFDYRYPSQARVVSGLISTLGIRHPVPMGHSYGGTIAAYTALQDKRVKRLVLVDAGILATGIPSFARYMFFPMGRLGAQLFAFPSFRRRFVAKSFIDPKLVSDDLVQDLCLGTRMDSYVAGTGEFFSQYMDVEVGRLLDGIRADTLLLWGAHDRNNPSTNGERMAARLRSAELHVIAGAGHYPHEERPRDVSRFLHAFLSRPARTKTSPDQGMP
jgi:pimeloyl-ACP methyl ester carboxylesterase